MDLSAFRDLVRAEGARRYRDLMWRRTRDPYIIWLSEVMLQQTQVARVEGYLPVWLERFPSVEALAEAPVADVLAAWQGMGYNRRALALHRTAGIVARTYGGIFPHDTAALKELPGIGPATAQGIRAFAFDLPGVYLETNVRTVMLHHLFPDVPAVPDRELMPLVQATCPAAPGTARGEAAPFALPADAADTPRAWYYALLDYGAYLKKIIPNPSRRSAGYARQKPFEGSRRQKRAQIVRLLLDAHALGEGMTAEDVAGALDALEREAGRPPVDRQFVASLLEALEHEGFCACKDEMWTIR